jgi:hypothetical protein
MRERTKYLLDLVIGYRFSRYRGPACCNAGPEDYSNS